MCDDSNLKEPIEDDLTMRDAKPLSTERREKLLKRFEDVAQRHEQASGIRPDQLQALDRLIKVAQGCTGQSALLADFLLAWQHAPEYGGFDLKDLWGLDFELREDAVAVFGMIAYAQRSPESLGYAEAFGRIARAWREGDPDF